MPFRVLSYNILLGGKDRLAAIESVIRQAQPDVVALLEANSRANAATLAKRLDMRLYYGEGNSDFAVAWLSRLPVDRVQNYRLPILDKTLLEIELTLAGEPISLFATHLAPGYKDDDELRRLDQVEAILSVMASRAGRPHLLAGDFNAIRADDPLGQPPQSAKPHTMQHRAIAPILMAGYSDLFRQLHPDNPGYTYNTDHLWLRLDYLFASPELAARVEAADLIDTLEARAASDHLPLWAELTMPGG